MTTPSKPREWTVAGLKRFLELQHRNLVLDNLWPDGVEDAPPDYCEYIDMANTYTNGTNNMASVLERLDKAVNLIKRHVSCKVTSEVPCVCEVCETLREIGCEL